MRSLAVIPARGGSKRIPRKNLAPVGGKSLVARAVESASPCGLVLVSTDDPDVVRAVSGLLAEGRCSIHARRPEHATDGAGLEPVLADALRSAVSFDVDVLVLLQPTSPFRTAEHVAAAMALLVPGVDTVVSVVRDPGFRFMGRTATNGEYRAYRPDLGHRPRSQERDVHCPVRENGAIYATRVAAFERSGLRMSGVMRAYEMSMRDSIEIDESWELVAADAVARSECL